jgi:hypothetical protein
LCLVRGLKKSQKRPHGNQPELGRILKAGGTDPRQLVTLSEWFLGFITTVKFFLKIWFWYRTTTFNAVKKTK